MKTETVKKTTSGNGSPKSYSEVALFMASHSGPWVLLIGTLVSASWKFIYGTWGLLDVLIIASIVALRGVIEWLLHTYFHHARPVPFLGLRIKTPIHKMHLQHHRNPSDLDSFLFKGRSLAGAIVIALIFFRFFPLTLSIELSFLIGVLLAILIQEVAHVICHSSIHPKWPFLREIISLHRRHHHEDASRDMGVSSMLGDRLFGSLNKNEPKNTGRESG